MKTYLTLFYFIIFICHQIAEKVDIHNHFIDSFLDDFLFLPLFIFTVEKIMKLITDRNFRFSKNLKFFTIIYTICIVEIIFPTLSNRFTFDYWDFAAYGLGYFFYIGILKIYFYAKVKTS